MGLQKVMEKSHIWNIKSSLLESRLRINDVKMEPVQQAGLTNKIEGGG